VDVVFGPVLVEVILPLVLVYAPATFPLTLTEKLQVAPAESPKPLTLIKVVFCVTVIVGAVVTEPAEHEMADKPFGVLITNPVGNVSEKLMSLKVPVLGLPKVKVNVLALPWAMVVGENALESVGTTGRRQPVI